jgi:putative transposase
MDSQKKEQIGLFRFGLIFPLLDERLQYGDITRLMKEICSKDHDIPYSDKRTVSMPTLYNWLNAYRRSRNIEDLYPRDRSDKGSRRKLSSETEQALLLFSQQHPTTKITTLVRMAEKQGIFLPSEVVDMSLIYRVFRNHNSKGRNPNDKDMRRLEMEYVNQVWYLDAMVGPKVHVGQGRERKLVTSKLFALIDDKSRLITYARFYRDETSDSLLDCLWGGFNARGLPRQCHTDNGAAMRDERIKLGCAALEVNFTHSRPYTPTGKAKVERLFSTVRMQFLPTLGNEPLELYELNKRWVAYLEEYNDRYHSGIGMSPLQCYLSEVQAVRPAPPDLPRLFRKREIRTVSKARTVSLDSVLLEVPLGYSGRKIELRYNTTSDVEAFYEGMSIGMLKPVDYQANSRAHRMQGVQP